VARRDASIARPMIGAFAVAAALGTLIAWRYIFPVPAVFSLVLCAVLIFAYVAARRSPAVAAPG
jgi:hypothetical protein